MGGFCAGAYSELRLRAWRLRLLSLGCLDYQKLLHSRQAKCVQVVVEDEESPDTPLERNEIRDPSSYRYP